MKKFLLLFLFLICFAAAAEDSHECTSWMEKNDRCFGSKQSAVMPQWMKDSPTFFVYAVKGQGLAPPCVSVTTSHCSLSAAGRSQLFE